MKELVRSTLIYYCVNAIKVCGDKFKQISTIKNFKRLRKEIEDTKNEN